MKSVLFAAAVLTLFSVFGQVASAQDAPPAPVVTQEAEASPSDVAPAAEAAVAQEAATELAVVVDDETKESTGSGECAACGTGSCTSCTTSCSSCEKSCKPRKKRCRSFRLGSRRCGGRC